MPSRLSSRSCMGEHARVCTPIAHATDASPCRSIRPWLPSYADELRASVSQGADAEAKLQCHLASMPGAYVIFLGPHLARLYREDVGTRMGKMLWTAWAGEHSVSWECTEAGCGMLMQATGRHAPGTRLRQRTPSARHARQGAKRCSAGTRQEAAERRGQGQCRRGGARAQGAVDGDGAGGHCAAQPHTQGAHPAELGEGAAKARGD